MCVDNGDTGPHHGQFVHLWLCDNREVHQDKACILCSCPPMVLGSFMTWMVQVRMDGDQEGNKT